MLLLDKVKRLQNCSLNENPWLDMENFHKYILYVPSDQTKGWLPKVLYKYDAVLTVYAHHLMLKIVL